MEAEAMRKRLKSAAQLFDPESFHRRVAHGDGDVGGAWQDLQYGLDVLCEIETVGDGGIVLRELEVAERVFVNAGNDQRRGRKYLGSVLQEKTSRGRAHCNDQVETALCKKRVQILNEGLLSFRRAETIGLQRGFIEVDRVWRLISQLLAKAPGDRVPRGEVRTQREQEEYPSRRAARRPLRRHRQSAAAEHRHGKTKYQRGGAIEHGFATVLLARAAARASWQTRAGHALARHGKSGGRIGVYANV